MDRIRGQITKPVLIGAGVGLVIGLIIGLFFAWMVWPVNLIEAPLENLRSDLQEEFLVMTVQSYASVPDSELAVRRWMEMGPNKEESLKQMLAFPPAPLTQDQVAKFAEVVGAGGAQVPGAVEPTAPAGATKAPAAGEKEGGSNLLNIVLAVMCVLTLGIAGVLAYLFLVRKKGFSLGGGRPAAQAAGPAVEQPVYPEGQEPPIVQYLTTYNLGNDLYDDSFSIDSPSGEFLGECGVGISDTIGVGDPKKVTAFEVWLFDKNDIQTVTKVVMSHHAFNDPAVSQRLASKGEPVLAEPSKHILLETATLQLEARVVNMNYGQGALPANSFFEQITLELAVWQK